MSAGAISNAGLMMGVPQVEDAPARAKTNRFAELESTEFIRILVQELANQDPFQPHDSAQILEQLSSLRNIESQTQLQERLKSLVLQNEIAQAGGMIGRLVQGLDEHNNRVEGVVTSVRVTQDRAILELDTGQRLPMNRVEWITDQSVNGSLID